MKAEFSRTLSDGRAGFPALLDEIEACLGEHGVPPGATAQLMIVLDEIISNILNHGGDGGFPAIDIALGIGNGMVSAEVTDDGAPFDPLSAPPPDTSLAVEDRPIGGLGIHLVRQLTNEVSYRRDAGRNRLRFSKDCAVG